MVRSTRMAYAMRVEASYGHTFRNQVEVEDPPRGGDARLESHRQLHRHV